MKRIVAIGLLLKEAARGWTEHRAQRLGAALAFYTTLALAPLTIVAIAVAGSFFGEEAARGGVVEQLKHLLGKEGAVAIEAMLEKASEPHQSRIAAIVSMVLLLFGATAVFAELKDSLDTIWEVKRKPGLGLWMMIKTQLLSFAIVAGTGFVLLASLLVTAALTAFAEQSGPGLLSTIWFAYLLDLLVSLLVVTFMFALIFKLLPDVKVSWKDVWVGAALTAVLFMIGKFLIGVYIGRASIGSIYGAAGSLVIVLVWTFYSSQILFFGAEMIRAYAKHFDPEPVLPTEHAVSLNEVELAKQGILRPMNLDGTSPT